MSWSFVHASFLLNRYVTFGNQTPFELVTGREYSGKICEFAEPILAYTYAPLCRKEELVGKKLFS